MALQRGKQHRRKLAMKRETELSIGLPPKNPHAELADMIYDKMKRRGEWKHKTKRSMSAASARSKSKKGGAGKSGASKGPA